jgi:Tfp pilus assembly protein PilF
VSVINQMLRDLERRGVSLDAPADRPAPGEVPAAPIVRPQPAVVAPARPPQLLRVAVWSAVVLIVAGTGIGYYWYAQTLGESVRTPQPLGARQFAGVAAPPVAAETAVVPANAAQAADTHVPVASAASPDRSFVVATAPAQLPQPVAPPTSATPSQPSPAAGSSESAAAISSRTRTSAAPLPPRASTPPVAPSSATGSAAERQPTIAIVNRSTDGSAAIEARAMDLISRGRSTEAMALLAQVLQQAPSAGNARAALAALQAEAGRRDLALQTLLAGSETDPERFAADAARLLAELGDATAALATLERVPAAARNAAHHALVAGIAQRGGAHRAAVDAYRLALLDATAPAVWWVGLAISLDALEQRGAALDAFRRAAADTTLPAATRSFVLARVGALSPSGGAHASPADVRSAQR